MTAAAPQGDGKEGERRGGGREEGGREEGGRHRGAERTRRSAARTHISDGLDDAPTLALEAFDQGAALIDLTNRLLAWCSAGFAARCCVEVDDGFDKLERRLPGLTEVVSHLTQPPAFLMSSDATAQAPRTGWQVVDANGPCFLEATLVRPGLAALRLRDGLPIAAPVEPRATDLPASAPTNAPTGAPTPTALAATDEQQRAARRHLEDRERLLFTSRSLAVGEMASTLAHELNQPIGTIANVLRGMRSRLERQGSNEALLGGVQLGLDQALFAARIIARIREYTHSRQPRHERLDLGQVVRESVGLLDWELQRDGVQIALDLAPEPCRVNGDEVMLQQLFVNLLRNALEAMRDNPADAQGRATRRLALRLATERGMAVLALRDNGCGLPQDAQAQLFVPFQSTKPNGMGIGLNICRSFVELHQGRLWFTPNDAGRDDTGTGPRTEPGAEPRAERGCTFHVALPLRIDDDAFRRETR